MWEDDDVENYLNYDPNEDDFQDDWEDDDSGFYDEYYSELEGDNWDDI